MLETLIRETFAKFAGRLPDDETKREMIADLSEKIRLNSPPIYPTKLEVTDLRADAKTGELFFTITQNNL